MGLLLPPQSEPLNVLKLPTQTRRAGKIPVLRDGAAKPTALHFDPFSVVKKIIFCD